VIKRKKPEKKMIQLRKVGIWKKLINGEQREKKMNVKKNKKKIKEHSCGSRRCYYSIKNTVYWNVTPWSLVDDYQNSRAACYFQLHGSQFYLQINCVTLYKKTVFILAAVRTSNVTKYFKICTLK